MAWLLSVLISSLIYTSTGSFPTLTSEVLITGDTPQLVVLTPASVLQGDETERFDQTYQLNPNGKISLDNVNGSIVIEAWDKNEVKLEAVKIANSRERLAEVQINVESKPDRLKIETEYGNLKNGVRNSNCSGYCRLEVQYKLTVPRNAVLDEIETVNGSVTISNMTNFTKASAVNGSVKATNLRGTANIGTVNGTSDVSFERLESDSKINLSTVNGRVNLVIPSDADATIKAETVNGSISNEFSLPVRKGKYVGRDLYGRLGEGTVKINLESVNGGLNIKRQPDGRNPKPVTNLLPATVSGDDDDGVDIEVAAGSVKRMNRELAKNVEDLSALSVAEAMKVAEQSKEISERAIKEASKAMSENAKEIARAQIEIAKLNQNLNLALPISWGDFGSSRVEEESDTFTVKGTPKVTVDAKDCSVAVRGWDKNEVKYRIVKLIRGVVQPKLDITVNHSDTEVMINATLNGQKVNVPNLPNKLGTRNEIWVDPQIAAFTRDSVRIEVFVPKKSNLRILSDREIRIEGITGSIDLAGGDGSINVRDSQGTLKINARDALVRVIGFSGEIDSKTADGSNFFEGAFAKFSANVVDGTIVLTIPDDANIDLKSNTKIQTDGFDLTEIKGNDSMHRIGSGGVVYNLIVDQGEILVRNAKLLKAKD